MLFTSSLWLAKYTPLREWHGRTDWPICGLAHSLLPPLLTPQVTLLSMPNLRAHDAIICSTPGAYVTLQRLFEGFQESASVRPAAVRFPDLMTRTIPLGMASHPLESDRASLRRQLDLPEDAIIYLFVGRFSMVNKVDLRPLIATFLTDPELPDGSVLVLAGDDTRFHLAEELAAFGRTCPGHHRLLVRPNLTSSPKAALLQAADVFVALSDTLDETFGQSIVEAMLAGLPVVASDWDGYRYLVTNGVDGLLVPTYLHADTEALSVALPLFPGASALQAQRTCIDLRALRNALRALGGSAELRRQMGDAARSKAERTYSWPVVVRQYEELWQEQVERGRQAATREGGDAKKPAAYFEFAKAFGHYPTRLLSDASCVACAPGSGCTPLASLLDDAERQVLQHVAASGPVTIGEVVRACTHQDQTASMVRARMSRLLKHGLLQLEAARESASQRRCEMHVDRIDHERIEKAAFNEMSPTAVEDAGLEPHDRLALVKELLAAGKLPKSTSTTRCPAFFYPGLPSRPIHPQEDFPWAEFVLSHVDEYLAELARLEHDRGDRPAFHTVWPDFTRAGSWAAFWLRLYGEPYEANASRCPRTLEIIEQVPGQGGWLGFSAMAPHTHVAPHCGVTNAKLRCHVPLDLVAGGSRIRVDDTIYTWKMGELLVFDDSFEHEVWNDSEARRVVLIFDIFHPALTAEEREFLTELESQTVRLTYNRLMREYQAASSGVDWAYAPTRS